MIFFGVFLVVDFVVALFVAGLEFGRPRPCLRVGDGGRGMSSGLTGVIVLFLVTAVLLEAADFLTIFLTISGSTDLASAPRMTRLLTSGLLRFGGILEEIENSGR